MSFTGVLLSIMLLIAAMGSPEMMRTSGPAEPGQTVAADAGAAAKGWTVAGQYDTSGLAEAELASLTTVSVSPSGRWIAAVNRMKPSPKDRMAAGIANPLGRLPDALYLFARQGNGYRPERMIPVDPVSMQELSSTLGGGAALAWNEDETRCVLSARWDSQGRMYLSQSHSNLYLLDLAGRTWTRLTDTSESGNHCVLPAWSGPDTIRFVRQTSDGGYLNALCELELSTGRETKIASLYSGGLEHALAVVTNWRIAGPSVYYTVDMMNTGRLCVSPVGGLEIAARSLVDTMKDLRETDRHPYCRYFTAMDASADGRWICLTVEDQRVPYRDFPFADSPELPQADPAHAISISTRRPWVPCHNVFLYDTVRGQLLDPFTAGGLAPTAAVVTAACFSPDGSSLLFTVFGDERPWSIEDLEQTAFYRMDLSEDPFRPERLFTLELYSALSFPEGLRWTGDLLCIPTDRQPDLPVQLIWLRPAE